MLCVNKEHIKEQGTSLVESKTETERERESESATFNRNSEIRNAAAPDRNYSCISASQQNYNNQHPNRIIESNCNSRLQLTDEEFKDS